MYRNTATTRFLPEFWEWSLELLTPSKKKYEGALFPKNKFWDNIFICSSGSFVRISHERTISWFHPIWFYPQKFRWIIMHCTNCAKLPLNKGHTVDFLKSWPSWEFFFWMPWFHGLSVIYREIYKNIHFHAPKFLHKFCLPLFPGRRKLLFQLGQHMLVE